MGQVHKFNKEIDQLVNLVDSRFDDTKVENKKRAALPIDDIVYEFQKNMPKLLTFNQEVVPLANRVRTLSQEKVDYYQTGFGFVYKFFSSLRNWWNGKSFTSSGVLGIQYAELVLNSVSYKVSGPNSPLELRTNDVDDTEYFEALQEDETQPLSNPTQPTNTTSDLNDQEAIDVRSPGNERMEIEQDDEFEEALDTQDWVDEADFVDTPKEVKGEVISPKKNNDGQNDMTQLLSGKLKEFPPTIYDDSGTEIVNPILTIISNIINKVHDDEHFANMLNSILKMWPDKTRPASWQETVNMVTLLAILLKDVPIQEWKAVDGKKDSYELVLKNSITGNLEGVPGAATVAKRIQIQLSNEKNQKTIRFLKQGNTTGLYYAVPLMGNFNVHRISATIKVEDGSPRIEAEFDGLTRFSANQVKRTKPDTALESASQVTWTQGT